MIHEGWFFILKTVGNNKISKKAPTSQYLATSFLSILCQLTLGKAFLMHTKTKVTFFVLGGNNKYAFFEETNSHDR